MPEIRHYEITGHVSFEIDAAIDYHEAVRLVEARLSTALKPEGAVAADPVKRAEIVAIDAAKQTPRRWIR